MLWRRDRVSYSERQTAIRQKNFSVRAVSSIRYLDGSHRDAKHVLSLQKDIVVPPTGRCQKFLKEIVNSHEAAGAYLSCSKGYKSLPWVITECGGFSVRCIVKFTAMLLHCLLRQSCC